MDDEESSDHSPAQARGKHCFGQHVGGTRAEACRTADHKVGTCKHIPCLYSERICAESTVERRDMALCARPSGMAAVNQERSVKFAFSVVSRKI